MRTPGWLSEPSVPPPAAVSPCWRICQGACADIAEGIPRSGLQSAQTVPNALPLLKTYLVLERASHIVVERTILVRHAQGGGH